MKSETVTPQSTSTCFDVIQSNVSKIETKKKKDAFFSSMLSNSDTNTRMIESEDDFEVLSTVDTNDFIFNPLDVTSRKAICKHLDMAFHKADLNHENIGENLSNRTPKVKTIGCDGNSLFRGLSVAITGWETSHLAFGQLICEHISKVGTYNKIDAQNYLSRSKMRSLRTYGTDIEIMAAAQIFGCDVYVYHMYGNSLKWLCFPCKHSSGVISRAIYLGNRYGNGKDGHFDYICGLF